MRVPGEVSKSDGVERHNWRRCVDRGGEESSTVRLGGRELGRMETAKDARRE